MWNVFFEPSVIVQFVSIAKLMLALIVKEDVEDIIVGPPRTTMDRRHFVDIVGRQLLCIKFFIRVTFMQLKISG